MKEKLKKTAKSARKLLEWFQQEVIKGLPAK
jgi:hypothetical protein